MSSLPRIEILLSKNKLSLKDFVEKNNIDSYDSLIEYCIKRKFLPCDEKDYNDAVTAKEVKSNESIESTGKISSPQKKKKTRNSNKKVKSSQKLRDSNDTRDH